jgi:Autotransporter beta-domain
LNAWRVIGLFSGLAVLGTASSAHAEGFELGARVGYGIPLGEAVEASDLSDSVKGLIPLQLDLGYRVTPALSIGGYLMYGIGFLGDQVSDVCDSRDDVPGVSVTCSARDVRVGLQAHYHFAPRKKLDPWLGAGIGYEWLSFGTETSGGGQQVDVSSTGKGFELINLQGGLDFRPAPGLGLGPFLSFSVGQYSSTSASCSGNACGDFALEGDGDIDDKGFHQWLMLGIRGTFVIGDETEPE